MIIRVPVLATAIAGLMIVASSTAALAAPQKLASEPGPATGPGSQLFDVAATSARNVWVVSSRGLSHGNGSAWSRVAIPGPWVNSVSAVTAVSADDAWAVGTHCPHRCASENALILHWNGTHLGQ